MTGHLVAPRQIRKLAGDPPRLGGVGELSVFCQSYFKQMLIGQAESIGGSTSQEVETE